MVGDHRDQYGVDIVPNSVAIADAAIPTVAALAPPDRFDVKLCDERVEPVDFDYPADFVGITGKLGHRERMLWLARQFRARGVTVIFGGPHASLAADEMRAGCDVLVRGELEAIAEEFFDDLYHGRPKREYLGPRGYIAQSPVPRWDLYPNHRAMTGTLQTSRGCPFECEFCDVIAYLGRKQSHKSVEQVLTELQNLHRLGYRRIMLADDNLTVFRARAKELLRALADWNTSVDEPVAFFTQLSIEISADDEMLELMQRASLRNVFVGIETPNEASLKDVKKRQNVGIDLIERTNRFVRRGVVVEAGLIVGFEHDTPAIFEQVLDFAMRSAVPWFNVAPLWAAHGTPLRSRMAQAGRLIDEVETATTPVNCLPAGMSLQQLVDGVRWLANELVRPENFEKRMLRMIELLPDAPAPATQGLDRPLVAESMLACHRLLFRSPESAAASRRILKAFRGKPYARAVGLPAFLNWATRLQVLRAWDAVPHAPVTARPIHVAEPHVERSGKSLALVP